jgi:raffinose/stachyose/melibiose transport system substrate-binding protein
MSHRTRKNSRLVAGASVLIVGALTLTACSGSDSPETPSASGSSAASGPSEPFTYLSFAENTAIQDTLTALSTGQCKDQNAQAKLDISTQPQASFDQQLQLLAGQGALPSIFPAGNAPTVAKDLAAVKELVDIDAELKALGAEDAILPAARSTIEKLYDGKLYVLPTEFNVEGFWYNKKLFADNGIEAPKTWDDLNTAAQKLTDAGVQAFSAAGADGWPLTRLVGSYIFRSLGADAMQAVADGTAKLTDSAYVEAAQKVADLGAKGYFGKSVGSIDYTTAMNEFLTGKSGMFYMGSWALGNFNDPKQNQIGADNIGFVPFPSVTNGKGDGSELAANVGVPLAMSRDRFDAGAKSWLDCIAKNFGTQSLTQGVITGFTAEGDAGELPPLTAAVQDQIAATKSTVLWFEALFAPKATTTSQVNAQLLVTGKLSPEDYMGKIRADLG